MNIAKYAGYFHDGYVNDISQEGNNISFSLESSVIEDSSQIVENDLLSSSNTLKGTLNLANIKCIKVDDRKDKSIPWKDYDECEILDLKIQNNKVFLLVEWVDFPPKARKTDVSKIEIEAEEIHWINIPDLPE